MKKILLSLCAFCAVATVSAQNGLGIQYGFKAGLNLSSLSGVDVPTDMKTIAEPGYYFGVSGEYAFDDRFSLQAEALYSRQGFKFKKDPLTDRSLDYQNTTYRLHYITVPVMAKYEVADKLDVMAGAHFGVLLSANKVQKEGGVNAQYYNYRARKSDVLDSEETAGYDVGLNVGASYEICDKTTMDVRYLYGVRDCTFGEGNTGNNRTFQVGFSRLF